jgi:ribosomal protein L29
MGELADRLDAIAVRAQVPGIEIVAELRDRTDVTISFGEAVYEFISEVRLENYLGSLARLLYAGWLRQYRAAIDDSALDVDPHDQRDHDFLDARAEIESTGASSDGRITFSAVGMQDMSVDIAAGTLRELTEEQFSERAKEAVAVLIQDHLSKVRELKRQFYA